MAMRTLIVDDEAPARERLKRYLSTFEGVEVVGEASDGVQAVEMIEAQSPDLVLLDIQMPGLDGFGVVEALKDPPAIVFVTAYDQYAIRAFEVHALDYLLKPYSDERFEAALEHARKLIAQQNAQPVADQLDDLLRDREGARLERIVLKSGGRVRFLDVNEIDWIEAQGVYVNLHVGDKAL